MRMFQFHKKYFALTILLFLTETVIALYVHDQFIRPYFGDFLVVILLYCLLKSVLNISVECAAISVLTFSFGVEIAQYFHFIEYIGLAHSSVAKVVLGNSFSWMDLGSYVAGTLFVIVLEKFVSRIKSKTKP